MNYKIVNLKDYCQWPFDAKAVLVYSEDFDIEIAKKILGTDFIYTIVVK